MLEKPNQPEKKSVLFRTGGAIIYNITNSTITFKLFESFTLNCPSSSCQRPVENNKHLPLNWSWCIDIGTQMTKDKRKAQTYPIPWTPLTTWADSSWAMAPRYFNVSYWGKWKQPDIKSWNLSITQNFHLLLDVTEGINSSHKPLNHVLLNEEKEKKRCFTNIFSIFSIDVPFSCTTSTAMSIVCNLVHNTAVAKLKNTVSLGKRNGRQ